jgi:hypothetical protein
MPTEVPNNGGPIRRPPRRRPFLEVGALVSLTSAGWTVSDTVGLATFGVLMLWLAVSA